MVRFNQIIKLNHELLNQNRGRYNIRDCSSAIVENMLWVLGKIRNENAVNVEVMSRKKNVFGIMNVTLLIIDTTRLLFPALQVGHSLN